MSKKKIYVNIPVDYVCMHASKLEEAAREETELRALLREIKHQRDEALNKSAEVAAQLVEAKKKNEELTKQIENEKDSTGFWYAKYNDLLKEVRSSCNAVPEET